MWTLRVKTCIPTASLLFTGYWIARVSTTLGGISGGCCYPNLQRKIQQEQPPEDWSRIMRQAEGELERKPSTPGLLDHSQQLTLLVNHRVQLSICPSGLGFSI